MKYPLILLSLLLSRENTMGQSGCGTSMDAVTLNSLKAFYKSSAHQRAYIPGKQQYQIPLKFHIVRDNNGNGGLDTSLLPKILDTLNYFYKNAMLDFFSCNEIDFIDDNRFVHFESSSDEDALTLHDKANMINVYFMDTVQTNGNEVCGYAYLAGGPLEVFISNACAIEGNTTVHEIGHIFALIHTHGSSNSELTKELVDGSNCSESGDFICDTPADPNLADKVVYYAQPDSCSYSGQVVDAHGEAFHPMLDNIMSYTPSVCKPDSLTPIQYQRVYNALFYYGLINTICSETATAQGDFFINAVPNPFFEELTVYYQTTERSLVSLALYDMLGNRLRELFFDYVEAGQNKFYISFSGKPLAKGVYFITLTVNGNTKDAIYVMTKKE